MALPGRQAPKVHLRPEPIKPARPKDGSCPKAKAPGTEVKGTDPTLRFHPVSLLSFHHFAAGLLKPVGYFFHGILLLSRR